MLNPNDDDYIQNLTDLNKKQQDLATARSQLEVAQKMIKEDLVVLAMAFCKRPVPTNAVKVMIKPLLIKEKYWTEAENATYARELLTILMDFMVQDPGNHFLLIPIVHFMCNLQLKFDKLILPPGGTQVWRENLSAMDMDVLVRGCGRDDRDLSPHPRGCKVRRILSMTRVTHRETNSILVPVVLECTTTLPALRRGRVRFRHAKVPLRYEIIKRTGSDPVPFLL